jgi:hypothetical protein
MKVSVAHCPPCCRHREIRNSDGRERASESPGKTTAMTLAGPEPRSCYGRDLRFHLERVRGTEPPLLAWEVSVAIRGLSAETLAYGTLARLTARDRELLLGLTQSGTTGSGVSLQRDNLVSWKKGRFC